MSGGRSEIVQEKKIRESYKKADGKIDLLLSFSEIGKQKNLAKKYLKKLKQKIEDGTT